MAAFNRVPSPPPVFPLAGGARARSASPPGSPRANARTIPLVRSPSSSSGAPNQLVRCSSGAGAASPPASPRGWRFASPPLISPRAGSPQLTSFRSGTGSPQQPPPFAPSLRSFGSSPAPASPRGLHESTSTSREEAEMRYRAAARLQAVQGANAAVRPPVMSPRDNGTGAVDAAAMRARAEARLQALRGENAAFPRADSNYSTGSASGASMPMHANARGQAARLSNPGSWAWQTPMSGNVSPRSPGRSLSPTGEEAPRSPPVPRGFKFDDFPSNGPGSVLRNNDRSGAGGMSAALGARGMPTSVSLHYGDGEKPMGEILRLDGGHGSKVVVGSVSLGSKAYNAGVREGSVLVSLNGRTEFAQLPGWQVRLLLEPPITLAFETPAGAKPDPGKGASELRLCRSRQPAPLGIPAGKSFNSLTGGGTWVVAEEIVFKSPAEERAYPEDGPGRGCWKGGADEPAVRAADLVPTGRRSRRASPRTRNDRSPLRWLAPILGELAVAVCDDGSDDDDDSHRAPSVGPARSDSADSRGRGPSLAMRPPARLAHPPGPRTSNGGSPPQAWRHLRDEA
eukprot:TRINITY_DN26466_c0_g1_i1.p1 TRINITY_DN26466_c0_g1~~TRINITY_DN26466_c0_g1_i1.p1  ORF type:complete len:569 (-),score=56.10 TRINITY_DN26466_c0_g1_i1:235-1941(-)